MIKDNDFIVIDMLANIPGEEKNSIIIDTNTTKSDIADILNTFLSTENQSTVFTRQSIIILKLKNHVFNSCPVSLNRSIQKGITIRPQLI